MTRRIMDRRRNRPRESVPSWRTKYGGEGGVRTHGTIAGTRDFQSRRFGRSRTSPRMVTRFSGEYTSLNEAGSLWEGIMSKSHINYFFTSCLYW